MSAFIDVELAHGEKHAYNLWRVSICVGVCLYGVVRLQGRGTCMYESDACKKGMWCACRGVSRVLERGFTYVCAWWPCVWHGAWASVMRPCTVWCVYCLAHAYIVRRVGAWARPECVYSCGTCMHGAAHAYNLWLVRICVGVWCTVWCVCRGVVHACMKVTRARRTCGAHVAACGPRVGARGFTNVQRMYEIIWGMPAQKLSQHWMALRTKCAR